MCKILIMFIFHANPFCIYQQLQFKDDQLSNCTKTFVELEGTEYRQRNLTLLNVELKNSQTLHSFK